MKLHLRADNLQSAEIQEFLNAHIDDMQAISSPESKHALDVAGLLQPNIQFWCAYKETQLVGCIALKTHRSGIGEIKSMRTAVEARGKGIGFEFCGPFANYKADPNSVFMTKRL